MYYGGYGMYNGFYSTSYILVIIGAIICLIASARVKSAYKKYEKVRSACGMTGAQVAEYILRRNGVTGVTVQHVAGELTDHYDPGRGVVNLSDATYNSTSVAAIGVAAHECGHALQHAAGYSLLSIRNSIVPVANIGSMLSWPMLILGLMLGAQGDFLFNLGIFLFLGVVLFHLVTLPVELDASKRALIQLEALNCFVSDEEHAAAKRVLDAAALTYLAALATAVANLLRMFAIRGNRR